MRSFIYPYVLPLHYVTTTSGETITRLASDAVSTILQDGLPKKEWLRYLLFFNNNDRRYSGYDQFKKVWNNGNQLNFLRNPAYMAVGEFRSNANQPIWFSEPKKILDTDGIAFGPKGTVEVAMYMSLTEKGERTPWYPDRKHFLLGKYITNKMLK